MSCHVTFGLHSWENLLAWGFSLMQRLVTPNPNVLLQHISGKKRRGRGRGLSQLCLALYPLKFPPSFSVTVFRLTGRLVTPPCGDQKLRERHITAWYLYTSLPLYGSTLYGIQHFQLLLKWTWCPDIRSIYITRGVESSLVAFGGYDSLWEKTIHFKLFPSYIDILNSERHHSYRIRNLLPFPYQFKIL